MWNYKERTVRIGLPKRYSIITVSIYNICPQLAGLYFRFTIQTQSTERQLDSLDVVGRNKKESSITKHTILSINCTRVERACAKSISFIILELSNPLTKK